MRWNTINIVVKVKNDGNKDFVKKFIDRTYAAIRDKVVAIIPQQKDFTYREHQKDNAVGPSMEEINKVTEGFMSQVAATLASAKDTRGLSLYQAVHFFSYWKAAGYSAQAHEGESS